jgi:hypothetical protein
MINFDNCPSYQVDVVAGHFKGFGGMAVACDGAGVCVEFEGFIPVRLLPLMNAYPKIPWEDVVIYSRWPRDDNFA